MSALPHTRLASLLGRSDAVRIGRTPCGHTHETFGQKRQLALLNSNPKLE